MEESERANSCWESNPGHLACEGWWLSGCHSAVVEHKLADVLDLISSDCSSPNSIYFQLVHVHVHVHVMIKYHTHTLVVSLTCGCKHQCQRM